MPRPDGLQRNKDLPAGTSTAGTPLNCDDGNDCTTDTCDAVLGCLHSPVPDGTSCGVLMTCLNGVCV